MDEFNTDGLKQFQASEEAKGKAKQLRLFALIAFLLAMAGQIFAIFKLLKDDSLVMLIVVIIAILILAIIGSTLWKKSNRLDPASEADKTRYFIQNQLGAILSVLAFLPLVIMIFTNKDLSGKTKGIAGGIATLSLLIAGIYGVDFSPPSIEKYTKEINAQTDSLKQINNGTDLVFWTKEGNKYHIFKNCYHIANRDVINDGTVKNAWKKKGISELCLTCRARAIKENNIIDDVGKQIDKTIEGQKEKKKRKSKKNATDN